MEHGWINPAWGESWQTERTGEEEKNGRGGPREGMCRNAKIKPIPLYGKLQKRWRLEDAFNHFSALDSDQVCVFPFLLPLAISAEVI